MIMILELLLAGSLVAPGMAILSVLRVETTSLFERLIMAYLTTFFVMFSTLYVSGIFMCFHLGSIVFLAIVALSYVYLLFTYRHQILSRNYWREALPPVLSQRLLLVSALFCLLVVYATILLTRPLLDSDVVQYYLPFAREIVREGGFTYSTGYDFNLFLKPVGVSVVYAWTYVISGSILSESFRLLPLVPVFLMVSTTYEIAREATESERLATLSALVFILLPLHDRLLYYNAFYPDVYYYPMIFFVILGTMKYARTRNTKHLLWIGVSFGVAGLIKAQTILFVLSFLLCLAAIEISSKKIVYLVCLAAPLTILLPNLLAEIGHPSAIIFSLGPERVALLLFASALTAAVYVFLEPRRGTANLEEANEGQANENPNAVIADMAATLKSVLTLVGRSLYVLIPFIAVSGLWYLNNLFRYGSLLYTSTVDIPNIEWASEIINSLFQSSSTTSYALFFPYFFFLLIDPAVMGFVWIVPLLLGLTPALRNRLGSNTYLLFYSIASVILIFAQTIYYNNPGAVYATNPRDLISLAPMLSLLGAMALSWLSRRGNSAEAKSGIGITTGVFVSYYGLMGYFHSVFLYFGGTVFRELWIYKLISGFLGYIGLTLQETTQQLWPGDRVQFISTHALSVAALGIIVAVPILILYLIRNDSWSTRLLSGRGLPGWATRLGQIATLPRLSSVDRKRMSAAIVVIVVSSVIIVPRAVVLGTQGGPLNSQRYQLSHYYGPIYELLTDGPSSLEGDILTYSAPPGLQYYLHEINIIDLRYSANLAHLRECFESATTYEMVIALREEGIVHLLFNPDTVQGLDDALNNSLSSIMQNETLSQIRGVYGSWLLYDLGPFQESREILELGNWVLDTRYASGNINYSISDSGISLTLEDGLPGDRIAIANYHIPKVVVSEYSYLSFTLQGTNNSRLLIRFYLENNTPVDVTYWQPPSEVGILGLGPYDAESLRGDAYISVISGDGTPAEVNITEISLVELLPVINRHTVNLGDWVVDARTTQGVYEMDYTADTLSLTLVDGTPGDRLTLMGNLFPMSNLSSFNRVLVSLSGSENVRILLRAYLSDGSPLDIAYWAPPSYFRALIPLPSTPLSFRGDVYLSIISSDGLPCSVSLSEIALLLTG